MFTLEDKKIAVKDIIQTTEFKHVAIIMDGNRRWAKEKKLPTVFGHKEGVKALKNVLRTADELGVKYVTVYAFSTENWNRSNDEVNFLMDLLAKTLINELAEMHENNIVINFIGDLGKLSSNLQEIMSNAVNKTKNNSGVNLQIAFNYGGRLEIVEACKKIAADVSNGFLSISDINEESFSKVLYTGEIPTPDLLIRTGGEMRISNFLLWQIAYSELYVTEKFWPDFGAEEFCEALLEFGKRSRRWGK